MKIIDATVFVALHGRLDPHPWTDPQEHEEDAYSLFASRAAAMGWSSTGGDGAGVELWGMNDAGQDWAAGSSSARIAWFQVGLADTHRRPLPVQQVLACARDTVDRIGRAELTGVQLLLPLQAGAQRVDTGPFTVLLVRGGGRGAARAGRRRRPLARRGPPSRHVHGARRGVGAAKAGALVAAFTLGRLSAGLADGREHVLVLVCDAANRLRRTVTVSEGAVDRALVPVREILNAVLRHDGRAFALAHNHPSGEPEPSDADIRATADVKAAATTVGLRFLGHVVVAGEEWREVR